MEISKSKALSGSSKGGIEVLKSTKSGTCKRGTKVISKLRKSFRMLKKAQVQLYWTRRMPTIYPLVSASNITVAFVGENPGSTIASKISLRTARSDVLKSPIEKASAHTTTRKALVYIANFLTPKLILKSANGTSNSTAAIAEDSFPNSSSCCPNKTTQTKFFDFTEPLPQDDYRSLMSVVLTLHYLPLGLNLRSVGRTANSPLLLDLTGITHRTIKKKVRFVPDLKYNEYKQTKCSTIIEFPDGSEELKNLIRNLRAFADVIVHLEPEVFSNIAWSLSHPLDEALSSLGLELRSSASEYPYPPHVKPDSEFQGFLRCLDDRTHQRYLCRDCDKFHAPGVRYKSYSWPTTSSTPECATQYIIGNNNHRGRLFKSHFRFSELQMAMKFYKQSLNFHRFLRPFNVSSTIHDAHGVCCLEAAHKTTSHRTHHIWTSETYVSSDRLLSRIQHFYHKSPNGATPPSKAEFGEFCETRRHHGGVTNLCRHLMNRCQNSKNPRFRLWDFEDQDENPHVRRCEDCALEYRYDWYDVGELGVGLVLTVWRDFGRCLTPFDPRFTAHFEEFEESGFKKRFKGHLGTDGCGRWKEDMESAVSDCDVGYIEEEFEAGEGFDSEECVAKVEGRFKNLLPKARPSQEDESA